MKKITRWKPDTCGCVLEYEWDTDHPEDTRVHTFVGVSARCPVHQGAPFTDKKMVYDQVLKENQGKNKLIAELLEFDEVGVEKLNVDGTTYREANPGIEFAFSFDEKREPHIEVKGLTDAERTSVTTKSGLTEIRKGIWRKPS